MKNNKGFTLIELLVVVLIIGILAAIALPQYTRTVEKSRASEALINLKALTDAAQRYYLLNGTYSGFDITPSTGNADVDVPAGTPNFSFALGTNGGTTLLIQACRKATSVTADSAGCTGPKYTITYSLTSGGWTSGTGGQSAGPRFCSGTDTSTCSAINAMMK